MGVLSLRTCVGVFVCLCAASPRAGAEEPRVHIEYEAMLRASRAYQETIPSFQAALGAVGRLADEFKAYTEADFLALDGARIAEEINNGDQVKILAEATDGPSYELVYDRKKQGVQWLGRTEPDKSSVSFYISWPQGALMEGATKRPGGKAGVELYFHYYEPNTPREAVTVSSGKWPGLAVQGPITFWDAEGEALIDEEVEKATPLPEVYDAVFQKLTLPQLALLGVGWDQRLTASPACRNMPAELCRAMANLARRGEDLYGAAPAELPAILRGDRLVAVPAMSGSAYHVMPRGEYSWKLRYDGEPERLLLASTERFAMYFGRAAGDTVIGGRVPYPRTRDAAERLPEWWLLSFHPGILAPRMAIAAYAWPNDSEGAGVLAYGPMHVWDRDGNEVLVASHEESVRLKTVLARVADTLSADQLTAMGWRGVDEEFAYLTGTY